MLLLAISLAAEARGRDEFGRSERTALAGHEKNNTVDANQSIVTADKNVRRGVVQEQNTRTIIILVNKAPEALKQNRLVNKTPVKKMNLMADVPKVISVTNITNVTFYNYVNNVTNVTNNLTNNVTYNVTYNVTREALPCACDTLESIVSTVALVAPQENKTVSRETQIAPVQPFAAFEPPRESLEQRFVPPPSYYDPREWGRIIRTPWGLQIQSRFPQPVYA